MPRATPIPALSDNYIWLLEADTDGACAIVDPGAAAPVREAVRERGLTPVAILITHRHHDHVGGLAELREAWPDIPVYGPAAEAVDGMTERVSGGDRVELPELGLTLDVIDTPGHTLGHIVFHGGGLLLCGDTLFAGGCGRVFEGTHAQMADSLDRLAGLPPDTVCCCGHEYTLANLAFARAVEPENEALALRAQQAQALRDAGQPTVPFELAEELATNPFLRCAERSVRAAAEAQAGQVLDGPAEVFATLREWKNRF